MCKLETLKSVVVEHSVADDWAEAKGEWELEGHDVDMENRGYCACSQNNLYHLYTIRNTHTRNALIVGSRCIQHFEDEGMNETIKVVEQWGSRMVRFCKYKGMNFQEATELPGFHEWHEWMTQNPDLPFFKKNTRDLVRYYSVQVQLGRH